MKVTIEVLSAGNKRVDPLRRFMAHVSVVGYCWEWQGCVMSNGYGQFVMGGSGSLILSHRASWILFRGEIPVGQQVLHHCDNRRCVHPRHLFVGTQADNMADARSKRRLCFGESNPRAKYSSSVVRTVRKAATAGLGTTAIAAQFGMSTEHVWRIVNRRTRCED